MQSTSTLSAQFFGGSPRQRVTKARQQLFDEGVRPTGLVGEAVIQSWLRCVGARRNPRERVEFDCVTRSRVHSVLNRNRLLLEAAETGLAELKHSLAGTGCRALLIDSTGVVVHANHPTRGNTEQVLPTLDRVGVNVAEGVIGTSAPGIVTKTGRACTVLGEEHFFETAHLLYCAAAPIRDANGSLAGVLDLSIESRPFGFDAESLVIQYATQIENRLLLARAEDQLVVHFHSNPTLLATPFEALAGISGEGSVAWLNDVARRTFEGVAGDVEALFGLSTSQLASLIRRQEATPVRLPSGMVVWARVGMHGRDGALMPVNAVAAVIAGAEHEEPSPPEAAPVTRMSLRLDAISREHIDRTLAACGDNVSRTARALGVSRGLIYRHLRSRSNEQDN